MAGCLSLMCARQALNGSHSGSLSRHTSTTRSWYVVVIFSHSIVASSVFFARISGLVFSSKSFWVTSPLASAALASASAQLVCFWPSFLHAASRRVWYGVA